MVSLDSLRERALQQGMAAAQYRCQHPLNLYDSPALERLATQAIAGRYLRLSALPPPILAEDHPRAIAVCLCEDDYPGWLDVADLDHLVSAASPYQTVPLSAAEIQARIPGAIAFAHAALVCPNVYLWGGTVGPNFDCSGLVQTAFAAMGVWLPRDAYQQEAFTQAIALAEGQPGDLVFFGPPQKATHVGLYLGNGRYIHSSGIDQGNNGIAIDVLAETGGLVSRTYYAQWRGIRRIFTAYPPTITL